MLPGESVRASGRVLRAFRPHSHCNFSGLRAGPVRPVVLPRLLTLHVQALSGPELPFACLAPAQGRYSFLAPTVHDC